MISEGPSRDFSILRAIALRAHKNGCYKILRLEFEVHVGGVWDWRSSRRIGIVPAYERPHVAKSN